MKEPFTSKDFYLSAYLIANGYELKSHFRDKGFTTFYFEDNKLLRGIAQKFYSLKAQVEPVKYSQAIRALKGVIYSSDSTSNQDINNESIHNSKGTK